MSLVKFQETADFRKYRDAAIASADPAQIEAALESAVDQLAIRDQHLKEEKAENVAATTKITALEAQLAAAEKMNEALKAAQPTSKSQQASSSDRTPENLFARMISNTGISADKWPCLDSMAVNSVFDCGLSDGIITARDIAAVKIYIHERFAKKTEQEQRQEHEQEKREERTYPFLTQWRAVLNILEAFGNPTREDCISMLYSLVDSKQLSMESFPFICIALADNKYKYKLLMSYMTQSPATALAHYNMTVFQAQDKYDKSMLYSFGQTVLQLSLPLSGLELMSLQSTTLTAHQQHQAGVASNQMNLHVLNAARAETPVIEGSGLNTVKHAEIAPKQAAIVQQYFSKTPGVQVGNHVIFGGANMPVVTIPIINRSGQVAADLAVDGTMIYTETRKLEEKIHNLNMAAYNKIAELEAVVKAVSRSRQRIPKLPSDVYNILLAGQGKLDKKHFDVIRRVINALRSNLKAERRKVESACAQAGPVTGGFPTDEDETFRYLE